MSAFLPRSAAASSIRALSAFVAFLLLTVSSAHAVIVRGTVTDPLGAPVLGAQIRLIQSTRAVAIAVSGPDGTYEIRSTASGRFLLLTSAPTFTLSIGQDFYGGRTDVVTHNITLEIASYTEQLTVTTTGISTPIQQASSAITLIPQFDLITQVGIVNDLRQSLGNTVVQTGQAGGVASLFVRGGNSDANKV
ncbi:MAG: carboxypeptidase regulatory-like domain-containing protein, partial [Edaphobacter sp.]